MGNKEATGKQDPLDIAKRYADLIPPPSTMFSSCIRAIRNAEVALGGGDLSPLKDLTASSTSFLIGVSPTLKAVFYKAAEDLHGAELKALPNLNAKNLVSVFQPNEVTAILTLTYLYRHLKKRCDNAELGRLMRKMLTHMQIGSIVGKTIRHIGSGNGMLLGGIRWLSQGLFILADLKRFQESRRKLEKHDLLFDLEHERAVFSCTHVEVASYLLQAFGYGRIPSMGLSLSHSDEELANMEEHLAEEILCWKIAVCLTESFHHTGAAPVVGEESEMYLPPEDAEKLKKMCWGVLRDGPTFSWITTCKTDLSAEIREALDITLHEPDGNGIEELEEGEESAG